MKQVAVFGAGAMGTALIAAAKKVNPHLLFLVFDKDESKLNLTVTNLNVKAGNKEDLSKCELILLAVKPQDVSTVLTEINELLDNSQTVLSVAAGISLDKLKSLLSNAVPVRCMPNTPALIGLGFSTISVLPGTADIHLSRAQELLSAAGKTLQIEEELQNSFTAIHGSGPAYVFLLIEAMISAAIKEGISEQAATDAVIQTVLGAAQLATQTGESARSLRERVTSPGGTTQAALNELNSGNFSELIAKAVKAARQRASELG